jgi:HD-GYP domain-containing protein (c-di-GMP phosphodiesterase class II)
VPAILVAGSVVVVLLHQVARSEPVWSEWWLDVPLTLLLSVAACAWWRSRAQRRHEEVADGVDAMAGAVEMRDAYTGEHSQAVVNLARRVGEKLGLTDRELSRLEIGARLHDVGKIGVPDAVLRKEGPLDGPEWEIMRRHPEWGAELVDRMPGLHHVSRIVRHAHERWDGDGYPDRLHRTDIPVESRIIFACDAYHAMTSDRPYRDALRPSIAVSELRDGAGGQFDPEVVNVLLSELRTERSLSSSQIRPSRVAVPA